MLRRGASQVLALFLLAITAHAAGDTLPLPPGTGRMRVRLEDGSIRLAWYHIPVGATPGALPLVVLHGTTRDAKGQLRAWLETPCARRFPIIAPEFPVSDYPGRSYELAGLGATRDPLTEVERLVDVFGAATRAAGPGYLLYGFSGGAQVAHRLALLRPRARFVRVIAASAGDYCLPDPAILYPGGLAHGPREADPRAGLSRDVTVLVGEDDVEGTPTRLYPGEGKGGDRVVRARWFVTAAQRQAMTWAVPLGWRLGVVPGACHDIGAMADAGCRVVLHRPLKARR